MVTRRWVRYQARRVRRVIVRQFRDTNKAEYAPLDLEVLADLMERIGARWYVTGTQAFNHFVGWQMREPHDLDVQIVREDLPRVHEALPSWQHYYVDCRAPLRWRGQPLPADVGRVVSRPSRHAPFAVEWLLATIDGGEWVYRYDDEIRVPWPVVSAAEGSRIPYAPPEIPLLYKSRWLRPKDMTDFDALLPYLDERCRTWLAHAISRADQNHPWLPGLRQHTDAVL